ncbi:MAG TPA: histidine kinase, partial [Chitinophaga sp.]
MLKKISKYWWCQILGWSTYFLINVFLAYSFMGKVERSDVINLIYVIIFGLAGTHLYRLIIRRNNWVQYSFDHLIILFFAGVVGIGVFMAVGISLFSYPADLLDFISQEGLKSLMSTMAISTTWLLIYFAWHYIERNRNSQVNQLKLESTVKELELKTIKAQLNPHFIFNALNSIRALVDENPQRARTAITELSNILRSSMATEKVETVSLEDELNIVKDYLALETIRFEERLKVQYLIDPATLELPIPPMMLQTLVENAIKHGISRQIHGGEVVITSSLHELQHVLTIRNTGQLQYTDQGEGHGFGLQSTRQRLSL